MRFLADQDVYAVTVRFLRDLGHDVVRAAELGLSRAEDTELLRVAGEQERLLVTRDRDFGHLIFVRRYRCGVIYLRMLPANAHLVHDGLEQVLSAHSEEDLRNAFVVVEPARYRFRHLGQ